jgi:hypothetical protein
MKTNILRTGMTVCASLLASALALNSVRADDSTSTAGDKTCTGTVTAVDAGQHVVRISEFFFPRSFVLGDSCTVSVGENPNAAVTDLRPGQKIMVQYKDAHGVLVADRIEQQKLHYDGSVTAIDPANGMLTVWHSGHYRKFAIASDCAVTLTAGARGDLSEVKPGDHISITYEVPAGKWTAFEIEQPSRTFVGTLDAIDLRNGMLKAKHMMGSERFSLADDCNIMLTGHPNARPADLRLGREYEFSYDTVNGVNVVNRIGPSQSEQKGSTPNTASAGTTPPQAGY